MNERKYDVVVVNIKTGLKVKMNRTPMTHTEACTFKSKITKYDWRIEMLEEVTHPHQGFYQSQIGVEND